MNDGFPEPGLRGGFLVHMNRVVVPGYVCEGLDILCRNGSMDDVGLTYFKCVVRIRIALHVLWVDCRQVSGR